ncbi:helix-turn-helix domain-containing protein [Brevibacillus brevis]|uniref:helix-turn-helix domain-containing protein n=1 Tax=Brevibacillus brevis TaxID=1393 RepID=UPI0037CA0D7E
MTGLEGAIRSIIAEEVATMERRLRESLSAKADRTLTFSEACEYLHMSEYTLRRLCREKRIPHRTHGADGSKNPRYLFSTYSLDRWIREEEGRNYHSES